MTTPWEHEFDWSGHVSDEWQLSFSYSIDRPFSIQKGYGGMTCETSSLVHNQASHQRPEFWCEEAVMSVDKGVRHCDSLATDACILCENSLCIYRAHLATEVSNDMSHVSWEARLEHVLTSFPDSTWERGSIVSDYVIVRYSIVLSAVCLSVILCDTEIIGK